MHWKHFSLRLQIQPRRNSPSDSQPWTERLLTSSQWESHCALTKTKREEKQKGKQAELHGTPPQVAAGMPESRWMWKPEGGTTSQCPGPVAAAEGMHKVWQWLREHDKTDSSGTRANSEHRALRAVYKAKDKWVGNIMPPPPSGLPTAPLAHNPTHKTKLKCKPH